MLDYEWGNSSNIMLAGDESTQDSDQSLQLFDNYHQSLTDNHHHPNFLSHPPTVNNDFSHHHHHHFLSHHQQQQQHSIYTPTLYPHPPQALDPAAGLNGFMVVPKSEEIMGGPGDFTAARIGLNLGHRTYFSSDDDFVNRLYRRCRPGPVDSRSVLNTPRCQVEGCIADLNHAKHYHRRHKVCEFHSKASTVVVAGLTQRFCQQCSRFQLLSEFDNGKRSCRKRLADHNRRRRKSQQQPSQPQNALSKLSPDNLTRSSPPDSGTHPSSSVTVAVSPPRMSLDFNRQRSYYGTLSSGSSSVPFYSNE